MIHIFICFGCSCRRAHVKHAPGGKLLVVGFVVVVVIAMIADESNVDAHE